MPFALHAFARPGDEAKQLSPILKWALLLGVVFHLGGFLLFRVTSAPLPALEEQTPFILFLPDEVMSGGERLQEQAILFDSAPLFIPTQWSATTQVEPDFAASEVGRFDLYEPAISLVDDLQPGDSFRLGGDLVRSPEDLLDLRFMGAMETFGQESIPVVPLADSAPSVWISWLDAPRDSSSARMQTLVPEGLGEFRQARAPAVFRVKVSALGIFLLPPNLVQSSGIEAADEAALGWLRKPSTVARLPPGYLELTVIF